MKTNNLFFAIIFLLLSLPIYLSSCGKGNEPEPTPPKPEKPEPKIPAWDKSKTATIYIAAKLQNQPIATTENEFKELGDYLAKKTFHAALINSVNINVNENMPINGGAITAFASRKSFAYALHTFSENAAKGTVILTDSIVAQNETVFSESLKIKIVPAKITSLLDLPLATLFLENQEQIEAFKGKLSEIYTAKYIIIGFISSSLYSSLEAAVKNSNQKLYLEKVKTIDSPNSIFILSPTYWLLRETIAEKTGNIPVYCLQIETNVFY
ncbi:MAG: hypothetical protein Q4G63_03605 [Bacteroidia bacterium]|nr:hypothetical protein [Bacteroidia bacterium]